MYGGASTHTAERDPLSFAVANFTGVIPVIQNSFDDAFCSDEQDICKADITMQDSCPLCMVDTYPS